MNGQPAKPVDNPVRVAYATRAAEYIKHFGSVNKLSPLDQETIGDWARGIDGPIVDAGSGPGQWTAFLHHLGATVEGIDIVPEFVASVHARFPQVNFRLGTFESLPVLGNSLSGILAWYTIIYTVPSRLQQVLAEFARCLSPGGSLLLGLVAYSQASWSHLLGLPEPEQE